MQTSIVMAIITAALISSPVAAANYGYGSSAANCVALTFDDGPDEALTPRLLDLLEQEGVTATFFLVGEHVEAQPSIARRIASEGHEIGNHSWSHPILTRLTAEQIAAEWARTDAAIFAATGIMPEVVRPPHGAVNRAVTESAGRPVILWSIATLDWLHEDVDFAAHRVLARARPGLIVLLHDNQPIVVEETARIIAGLRARGFGFSTVSDLLAGRPC